MSEMTDKLDILVVEDTPIHLEAARHLLKDYNLRTVSDFDSAIDLIAGGSYQEKPKMHFDAVLTDLYYTQGRGAMQSDRTSTPANTQQPYGFPLAMIAAKCGIPLIGILTDLNHHHNTFAYAFDFFKAFNEKVDATIPEVLQVNNSKIVLANSHSLTPGVYRTPDGKFGTAEQVGSWKDNVLAEVGSPEYEQEKWRLDFNGDRSVRNFVRDGKLIRSILNTPEGSQHVKNWKSLLDLLRGQYVPEKIVKR